MFTYGTPHLNIETNDKFYRKVAFMYTEMVNFSPQSCKAALKQKPHRGLGTRLPFIVIVFDFISNTKY